MVRKLVRLLLLFMVVYSFASIVYSQVGKLYDTTEPDETIGLELIEIYED